MLKSDETKYLCSKSTEINKMLIRKALIGFYDVEYILINVERMR